MLPHPSDSGADGGAKKHVVGTTSTNKHRGTSLSELLRRYDESPSVSRHRKESIACEQAAEWWP
ncbi:hypothetical protein O9993_03565 [Vibrio lentus]|nr:hypothetical protein [Vibrio lentus]